jgi:UDP-N-acetylmuramoylalanine--D-glutamate ligase
MADLQNLRIAVTGMGRSGVAVALAAKKRGALPTLYEEQAIEGPPKLEILARLEGSEIPVVSHWHGHLNPGDYDILVTSPGFHKEHSSLRDARSAGKEILSEIEFAYRIAKAPMICITGTNGKSTATVMTWMLLRAAGYQAVLCGNLYGSGYPELTLTEAADISDSSSVLVAEVSSFQLEWIQGFRPRVATITNITPDHLDRYDTFDAYYNTKLRIFQNLTEEDSLILNLAEPSLPLKKLRHIFPKQAQKWVYSSSPEVVVPEAEGLRHLPLECGRDVIMVFGQEIANPEISLCGEHSLKNALQALACACAFIGTPTSSQVRDMLEVLRHFRVLKHRMEVLGEKNGIRVINNSMCTNPMAVIASSKSLPARQHLLMGGKNKNLEFLLVREYLEGTTHQVYLFGPHAEVLNRQLGDCGNIYPTLECAFEDAIQSAKSGEVVMLAPGCASAFPYANFHERGEAFRAIVRQWLET